jgi:hypothetical protein
VHRDAVAASQFCYDCGGNRIGFIRLADLPQSGNVIDVDSKFGHIQVTGDRLQVKDGRQVSGDKFGETVFTCHL